MSHADSIEVGAVSIPLLEQRGPRAAAHSCVAGSADRQVLADAGRSACEELRVDAVEARKIAALVEEHREAFLEAWHAYFPDAD